MYVTEQYGFTFVLKTALYKHKFEKFFTLKSLNYRLEPKNVKLNCKWLKIYTLVTYT